MRISVYSPKMSGHVDFICDGVRLMNGDNFAGDISIGADGSIILKNDTKVHHFRMENGVQPVITINEDIGED